MVVSEALGIQSHLQTSIKKYVFSVSWEFQKKFICALSADTITFILNCNYNFPLYGNLKLSVISRISFAAVLIMVRKIIIILDRRLRFRI